MNPKTNTILKKILAYVLASVVLILTYKEKKMQEESGRSKLDNSAIV